MRRLLILGSTGSIGTSALDVVRSLGDRFEVVGLAAGRRHVKIAAQAREFAVDLIALADEKSAAMARAAGVSEVLTGPDSALELLERTDPDVVLQGMVGAAALPSTLAALEQGRLVALANKESLVMAGPILMATAERHGATLVPVDSEHSAIYQCLRAGRAEEVERILLTTSGGAFRDRPLGELADATPTEALRHPTWSMGRRITVDSATMMNKALEIAEAVALFGVPADRIRVVLHPQSIVHSMVEFRDGNVMAQMSRPDMRLPILFALAYPERPLYDAVRFSINDFANLTFRDPDPARYPALELGYRAAAAGGTAGAVLNAADEEAVQMFLDGHIRFTDIAPLVQSALEAELARPPAAAPPDLSAILDADRRARDGVLETTCRT